MKKYRARGKRVYMVVRGRILPIFTTSDSRTARDFAATMTADAREHARKKRR